MSTRPVVLVTGANSGIGKTIISRLARSGYNAALNYKIAEAAAENLTGELQTEAALAIAIYADVANSDELEGLFAKILGIFGKLGALVNIAGIQVWKPLLEIAE